MTEPPPLRKNAIRTWALVAVAVTSAFLIGISIWLIILLSDPSWCNRALGSASYADGRPEFAVGGCYSLLKIALEALAVNSHISISILALCLLSLVVIVLAGGRIQWKVGKEGISGEIDKNDGDKL